MGMLIRAILSLMTVGLRGKGTQAVGKTVFAVVVVSRELKLRSREKALKLGKNPLFEEYQIEELSKKIAKAKPEERMLWIILGDKSGIIARESSSKELEIDPESLKTGKNTPEDEKAKWFLDSNELIELLEIHRKLSLHRGVGKFSKVLKVIQKKYGITNRDLEKLDEATWKLNYDKKHQMDQLKYRLDYLEWISKNRLEDKGYRKTIQGIIKQSQKKLAA
jgi:hypothetical protein